MSVGGVWDREERGDGDRKIEGAGRRSVRGGGRVIARGVWEDEDRKSSSRRSRCERNVRAGGS